MIKNLFAPLVIIAFISFSSCKKCENATCTLSASTLIGTYRLTSLKQNGEELFPLAEECAKDDIYTFNSNGVIVTTDAGAVCSPSNNDTDTWSLSGTTLTVNAGTGNISNFSCNGFTVTRSQGSITLEITYSK